MLWQRQSETECVLQYEGALRRDLQAWLQRIRSYNCVESGNCLNMRFFSSVSQLSTHTCIYTYTYRRLLCAGFFFHSIANFPYKPLLLLCIACVFHCMFMHLTIPCLQMECLHLHFINRFAIESHKHGNDEQNTQHFQQNGSLEVGVAGVYFIFFSFFWEKTSKQNTFRSPSTMGILKCNCKIITSINNTYTTNSHIN